CQKYEKIRDRDLTGYDRPQHHFPSCGIGQAIAKGRQIMANRLGVIPASPVRTQNIKDRLSP
ncbi:MAG: hypothetical protein RLZZ490_742, partial [Cyanobacteriota bacterium]